MIFFQGKIAFLGETKKAPKFFSDLGLPIPINYNPCDHYIHHIALVPGMEEQSYKKMDQICESFAFSKIARKNQKRALERENYRKSVCNAVLPQKPKPNFGVTFFWLLWRALISHVIILYSQVQAQADFDLVPGHHICGNEGFAESRDGAFHRTSLSPNSVG